MDLKNIAKICFLQDFDLFKELDRKVLLEISCQLELLHLSKGSELLLKEKDNDLTFFLKTGTIKIVTQPNNYTKYIIKEGNIFGELSLVDVNTEEEELEAISERAVALEDAVIFYIKAYRMRMIIDRHNALKDEVLNLYSIKLKKLENRIKEHSHKDGKTRIIEYLFYYLSEFGKEKENRLEAKNLLSNSDIAHLTNTSRQTVNRVMVAMRKEGIIEYDSKKIYKVIKT